jgi:Pretoxin HINT domain
MQMRIVGGIFFSSSALVLMAVGVVRASGEGARESAARLVADALQAELDGNTARRRVLLSEAVDAAPDYKPARWQSGQMLKDGEWLPVEQAQQAAAADPQRAQYESLRAAAKDKPAAQFALARWCRKNGLKEEASFHWKSVLAVEPQNEEALRALGVRWFQGRLMTKTEIAAAKADIDKSKQAAKAYSQQVSRWQRLLSAGDIKSRDQALEEIRQLRDVNAIAAMDEITLDAKLTTNDDFEECLKFSKAWLIALVEMPEQQAALSLARHAAFSPLSSIRAAATDALKDRPLHDFVPQLLSALAMPIESTYRIVTDTDGSVHYFHSLYREGPLADWSFEGRLSAMQHDLQGPTDLTIDDRVRGEVIQEQIGAANNPLVRVEMASVARGNQQQFGSRAMSAQRQIAAANRATEAANAVVIPLLTATTGEDFGDNPRAWWDWWLQYNEYSSDDGRAVNEQRYADSTHRYYRQPKEATVYVRPVPDPVAVEDPPVINPRREVRPPQWSPWQPRRMCECFAAGTLVWTRTGLEPIESLEIGQFVLSQDAATGELAFKPVLGRTVRPASPCLQLGIGDDQLVATLGHPLWVTGIGWRMAKELDDNALVHGVNGPVELKAIAEADDCESYNLIVADFNTYFVGKSGALVHDNTPRAQTTAIVPGLAGK